MSLQDTSLNLTDVCRQCGGFCCTMPVINSFELSQLKQAGYENFAVKRGKYFKIKAKKGKCVFLGENGCNLPQNLKPTDCRLFPIYFNKAEESVEFFYYPKELCPFIKKFKENKNYLEETKEFFKQKMNCWTEGELREFTKKHSRLNVKFLGIVGLFLRKLVKNI